MNVRSLDVYKKAVVSNFSFLKEAEERKKQLENIRIKEWEEKFDKKQKEKELDENRRELKLKKRELEGYKKIEPPEDESSNLTLALENFNIDKNTKN